jgi:hypothetical protein
MKNPALADWFAAVTVALLLVLTAWGNAVAMFVVSTLALVVSLLVFGRTFARGGALAAAVGCVVAMVIALVMRLG